MRLAVVAVAVAFFVSTVAFAQANNQSGWDKTYPVSSRPNLQVEVDDVPVQVRSCGGCRAVHIHVDPHGQDLSKWRITEMQGGSGIHFSMRHPEERSFLGMNWRGQSPEVIVETPGETDAAIRSSNGSLAVTGLHGSIDLKTSNGAVSSEQTSGPLRANTSNGAIRVRSAEGSLSASTSNGSMDLQGRFSQMDARTSEGSVAVQLLPGSNLQSSSRVSTSDGAISMSVPRDLHADVQASTTNGRIANGLNLQNSTHGDDSLRGQMNGGGPALQVRTTNGSIALSER